MRLAQADNPNAKAHVAHRRCQGKKIDERKLPEADRLALIARRARRSEHKKERRREAKSEKRAG